MAIQNRLAPRNAAAVVVAVPSGGSIGSVAPTGKRSGHPSPPLPVSDRRLQWDDVQLGAVVEQVPDAIRSFGDGPVAGVIGGAPEWAYDRGGLRPSTHLARCRPSRRKLIAFSAPFWATWGGRTIMTLACAPGAGSGGARLADLGRLRMAACSTRDSSAQWHSTGGELIQTHQNRASHADADMRQVSSLCDGAHRGDDRRRAFERWCLTRAVGWSNPSRGPGETKLNMWGNWAQSLKC